RLRLRRVILYVAGHIVTLSLVAGGVVTLAPRMIEAALGLSVIVVGVDNLLVLIGSSGVGVREWLALTCGLVRGCGYVSALQDLRFPRGMLGWSLFSFSAGIELGQILVIALAAFGFAMVGRLGRPLQRGFAYAGSLLVVAAGVYWFLSRGRLPL